jgi:endonuclease YncB( thermonuclease family)
MVWLRGSEIGPLRTRQMRHFRRPRHLLLVVAVILALAGLLRHLLPPEPPLIGHAKVVDGDTLRLDGERIRLLGIDAPELAQSCSDASGADWSCGAVARTQMASMVGSVEVMCRPDGRDRYSRTLAHCSVGTVDLGQAMVRAGLAVSDGEYFREETSARADKAGIWVGTFMLPAEWRRQHQAGADDGQGADLFATVRSWFR